MSDESPLRGSSPADEPSAEQSPPAEQTTADADALASRASPESAATTPGGYPYSVVDDDTPPIAADGGPTPRTAGVHPMLVAAAAVVPAVIVGVVIWFVASSGGGGGSKRVNADVSNIVNAFSQAQGSTSNRYEGTLAPGYPDGLPSYPGARLLSSLKQIRGQDASYLVIYDTSDKRQNVSAYFEEKLSADPWQIDAGQDGRDSALNQFSKIDDPNIRGLVLSAQSSSDDLTTIVVSLQVTAGAKDGAGEPFDPGVAKTLPEGFPDAVPPYPSAILIESAYQKQANARTFVVSFVTKDDASSVLDFYRKQFQDGGLTVTDGDASQSGLQDATAVDFTDAQQTLGGAVTAGKLAEDNSYTRIDLQVRSGKSSS